MQKIGPEGRKKIGGNVMLQELYTEDYVTCMELERTELSYGLPAEVVIGEYKICGMSHSDYVVLLHRKSGFFFFCK